MLTFSRVDTQEKLDQWHLWASEFHHDVENPMGPIVTVSDGGQVFADYMIFTHPIIFPSFNPSRTTARLFKEACDAVSNAAVLASLGSSQFPNGVSHAAIPIGSHITDTMLAKVGYQPMGCQLYRRL